MPDNVSYVCKFKSIYISEKDIFESDQKSQFFKPASRMNCIAMMYCIRELMLYNSFLLFSLEYCEQYFLCFFMNNINICVK